MSASQRDQRFKRAKVLLVEGEEEVRFFKSLCKRKGIDGIQVVQYGGKNKLHTYLEGIRGLPGFGEVTRLGVTRDADTDFDSAFQSVADGLRKGKLPVPTQAEAFADAELSGGHSDDPAVAVFVLPDCRSDGMLETLCVRSVQDQEGMACVDRYFECMREQKRSPKNDWKARVHAWLASEEEPDKRLGEAAQAGYWPFDHEVFAQLHAFLASM